MRPAERGHIPASELPYLYCRAARIRIRIELQDQPGPTFLGSLPKKLAIKLRVVYPYPYRTAGPTFLGSLPKKLAARVRSVYNSTRW
jgi:hypothetical protein